MKEILIMHVLIACKSVAVYMFIILAIRIFGKKELAQLSVIDLVFILLISNSVQNAMVGDNTTLTGGMAAALGLFISNYIFKFLINFFPKLGRVVQGEKIVLIADGKILQLGLKQAGITTEELERAIREHGAGSISDVNLAILEIDGNISVLTNDFTKRTVKKHAKPYVREKGIPSNFLLKN